MEGCFVVRLDVLTYWMCFYFLSRRHTLSLECIVLHVGIVSNVQQANCDSVDRLEVGVPVRPTASLKSDFSLSLSLPLARSHARTCTQTPAHHTHATHTHTHHCCDFGEITQSKRPPVSVRSFVKHQSQTDPFSLLCDHRGIGKATSRKLCGGFPPSRSPVKLAFCLDGHQPTPI